MRRSPVLPLVLLALLAACSEAGPADPLAPTGPAFATAAGAQHYVIVANRWQLPSDLEASVQAAGGTLTGRIDRIGVATATSDNPDFIRAMEAVPGIQAAAPDLSMRWTDPDPGTPMLDGASGVGPAGIGDDETYFSYQWAPRAIHAPEAWAAGYTGAGVRVAIIDGGIYHAHIDLRDNIDAAHSRSFVPGKAWNEDVGTFWHGTHVAGIV
ncbi:MAG TPA: S8 family serine peptidase, partial [Longimicrobiales bacterium]|nr:S8 family serine peptidase [Longimicrobiales bacterium]